MWCITCFSCFHFLAPHMNPKRFEIGITRSILERSFFIFTTFASSIFPFSRSHVRLIIPEGLPELNFMFSVQFPVVTNNTVIFDKAVFLL